MKKIKLLFLCNSPQVMAGVEKTVLLLFKNLRHKIDIRFILNGYGDFYEALISLNADVEVYEFKRRISKQWKKFLY